LAESVGSRPPLTRTVGRPIMRQDVTPEDVLANGRITLLPAEVYGMLRST
jgi:hypothetical protein